MSQKIAPAYIRVKGKIYRKAAKEARSPVAVKRAREFAVTLDEAAEAADIFFRSIGRLSEGDKTGFADLTNDLIRIDTSLSNVIPNYQRLVKILVRTGMLDERLIQAYLPWALNYYRSPRSPESEERRQPVISKDITDWEQVPGGESPNETLYPYPLNNLHRSSVPHAIKVGGYIYRKV